MDRLGFVAQPNIHYLTRDNITCYNVINLTYNLIIKAVHHIMSVGIGACKSWGNIYLIQDFSLTSIYNTDATGHNINASSFN
ncbi:hypothetical protein [Dapis sp. BLCC M172]|uniref:hypothetical protein n=1 Tax=Dapis sp. BLCC M172 TaxID=2975281 RepID=UPI003CF336CE